MSDSPAAAPAYSPRLLLATAKGAADDDDEEYFNVRTPKGADIIFLGQPATCPPAPRKPPPPASRKRLFAAAAADMITLRFDDLEAIFCPASLSDGVQRRHRSKDKLTASSTRRSVGAT